MSGQPELPRGWDTVELRELFPIAYGKGLPHRVRVKDGAIPVYGSSGVVGHHDTSYTAGPTIIIGRKGNVGAVHLSKVSCWPIDTVYFSEGTASINLSFMAYLLSFQNLDRLDKSTAIPGLSRDDYDVVQVPLPPQDEQHRIVEVIERELSKLDDAVANLERVRANLKRYRASVLKAAVEGRLVPTEAELARKEKRDYEPAPVLLRRILKERHRRWEEAELEKMKAKGKVPTDDKWKAKYKEPVEPDTEGLPELPEGWCWASVERTSTSVVDCPHSTPKWTDSGKICVRTTEFHPGFLDLSGARFVSDETFKFRIQRLKPDPGDILYSREGGILGIACCVPPQIELCMGQRMMLIRPNKTVSGVYIMHVLNSSLIIARVKRLTGGSASPHVNVGDIKAFPIPLPPRDEMVRICGYLEQLSSQITALEQIVSNTERRCDRLRQSILKAAFEGKLVPQDPNDEPASVLLERIRKEREKVEAEGKTKKKTRGKKKAKGS